MSESERRNLKATVRRIRNQERLIGSVSAKLEALRTGLKESFNRLNELEPHGDPVVLRFGNKTVVVSRANHGLGDVEVKSATVA